MRFNTHTRTKNIYIRFAVVISGLYNYSLGPLIHLCLVIIQLQLLVFNMNIF